MVPHAMAGQQRDVLCGTKTGGKLKFVGAGERRNEGPQGCSFKNNIKSEKGGIKTNVFVRGADGQSPQKVVPGWGEQAPVRM